MIILEGYKIIKKIASGGMGDVYLAEHTVLETKVAIKSLHSNLVNDEDFRKRFKIEARVQAKLSHPNIVKLIDFQERKDGLYLIMEYVEGKQLDDYIRDVTGPMPDEKLFPLFKEILSAIKYAHSKGLIHRDIKPSNILITAEGNAKIIDFGIAKSSDEDKGLTKTGVQVGTVSFMSPEQVRAKKLDLLTDIYSLGIMLFQMAVGQAPYSGQTNTFEIQLSIVSDPLPNPKEIYPSVSDKLVSIIEKATQKNKKDRFQSCDEFIKSFDKELVINKIKKSIPEKNITKPLVKSKKTLPIKKKRKSVLLAMIITGLISIVSITYFMNLEQVKPKGQSLENNVQEKIENKKSVDFKYKIEDFYIDRFDKKPDYGDYINVSSSYFDSTILFSRMTEITNEPSHRRYGKIKDGISYVQKDFKNDSDWYFNWEYRGEMRFYLGEFDDALDDLNKATDFIKFNSDSRYAYNSALFLRSKIKYMLGDYNGAINDVNLVSSMESENYAFMLGIYYLSNNDYDSARQNFDTYFKCKILEKGISACFDKRENLSEFVLKAKPYIETLLNSENINLKDENILKSKKEEERLAKLEKERLAKLEKERLANLRVNNSINTKEYSDGTYIGNFKNGLRHGKGKYTWKENSLFSGDIYEGDWINDVRTGKGKYTWKESGNNYEGDFINGLITGKGKFTWKESGNIYEGDWVDGSKIGKGKYILKSGDFYEGDWINDVATGKGKFTYKNSGDVYEGDFVNYVKSGKGKYTWKETGDIYEGDWVDGVQTGKAKLTWKESGDIYEGDWINAVRSGKGKYSWKNSGDIYEGDFVDDVTTGKGKYTWRNGDVFVGDFNKDVKGKGRMYFKSSGKREFGEYNKTGEWKVKRIISK